VLFSLIAVHCIAAFLIRIFGFEVQGSLSKGCTGVEDSCLRACCDHFSVHFGFDKASTIANDVAVAVAITVTVADVAATAVDIAVGVAITSTSAFRI
jgi:hypothetical protein